MPGQFAAHYSSAPDELVGSCLAALVMVVEAWSATSWLLVEANTAKDVVRGDRGGERVAVGGEHRWNVGFGW